MEACAADAPSSEPEPSVALGMRQFIDSLDPDDDALLRARAGGDSFKKLGADDDVTPDALRKREKRLLERFQDDVL